MAKDHEVPEAMQLDRAWARGRGETESRQKAGSTESVTAQCRMR